LQKLQFPKEWTAIVKKATGYVREMFGVANRGKSLEDRESEG